MSRDAYSYSVAILLNYGYNSFVVEDAYERQDITELLRESVAEGREALVFVVSPQATGQAFLDLLINKQVGKFRGEVFDTGC